MLELLVVDHRRNHSEFFDALWVIECQSRGDRASVRASDHSRTSNSETIHEPFDNARLSIDRVIEPFRLFRESKSDKIERNHTITLFRQSRCANAPCMGRCGVTVNQNYRRIGIITEFLKVNTNPIDFNEIRIIRICDEMAYIFELYSRGSREKFDCYCGADGSACEKCNISFLHGLLLKRC